MIAEFLIKSIKLPKTLIKIAFFTKKCLFWIFVEHSNVSKVNQSKNDQISPESETTKHEMAQDFNDKEINLRCNFCNKCSECEQLGLNEKKKKMQKEEKDSNVAALNYFAFLCLFLVIFFCDIAIWILIGV